MTVILRHRRKCVIDICDYEKSKVCPLYDNSADVIGQAFDVYVTTERNGWKEQNFTLPATVMTEHGEERNPRLDWIRADYAVRLKDDKEEDWFLISKPQDKHDKNQRNITVTAGHISQLQKTKQQNVEFNDDEGNNVGTASELLAAILEGTGWKPGTVAEFYEERDPSKIKVRSLKCGLRTGAFKMISQLCDLFDAKPVYHGSTRTVDIIPMNPFSEPKDGSLPDVSNADGVLELTYGRNLINVTRTLDTSNLVTKLYANGAWGDNTNKFCSISQCKHKVHKYITDDDLYPGTVCSILYTDETGVTATRYFTVDEYTPTGVVLLWSQLDRASMSYVTHVDEDGAFVHAHRLRTEPEVNLTQVHVVPYEETYEEANELSYIMDFTYYQNIGLVSDALLQKIAKYQVEAPEYARAVAATQKTYGEYLETISNLISTTDYCQLNCKQNGGIGNQNGEGILRLNRTPNKDGTIWRTDYDVKPNKQFEWRTTSGLYPNGDPIDEACATIIVLWTYEDDNHKTWCLWEKRYLKDISETEDEITLKVWNEFTNYPAGSNPRVFLFASDSIHGLIGGFEAISEAIASSTTQDSATVKHPLYFSSEMPPIPDNYAWWFNVPNTPSNDNGWLYFCDPTVQRAWRIVYWDNKEPNVPESARGAYYFDWEHSVLYRRSNQDEWVKLEGFEDKKIAEKFGTAYTQGVDRWRAYWGEYDEYSYTLPQNKDGSGNWATMIDKYRDRWYVWTGESLHNGAKLTYQVSKSDGASVYGGKLIESYYDGTSTATKEIEVKVRLYHSVRYHPANIFSGYGFENGGISANGADKVDNNYQRSGYSSVYGDLEYEYNGSPATIYLYNTGKTFITSYSVIDGDTITTDRNTAFARVSMQKENAQADLHYINFDSSIIYDDITYQVIPTIVDTNSGAIVSGFVPSETRLDGEPNELSGLVPCYTKLRQQFWDAYNVTQPELIRVQKEQTDHINQFIDDMGDLYREGWMQKDDYVDGDEDKLYEDAIDDLKQISKPDASYAINFIDLYEARTPEDGAYFATEAIWPDVTTLTAVHLLDPELDINLWAFVDKVKKCYDKPWKTSIDINTNLTTMTQHSFTDVMARIAEVSNSISGKTTMYDRAANIGSNGALNADALEGLIDADTVKLRGACSTWKTDKNGNIVFESADGKSAMTLTGNGFMIANSRKTDGSWNWRTFGTGDGFTADEIRTGHLSADRIGAGTIDADLINVINLHAENIRAKSITIDQLEDNTGNELDISGNATIDAIQTKVDRIDYTPNVTSGVKLGTFTKPDGTTKDVYSAGYTLSKSGSTITLTGGDGSQSSVTDNNTTYSLTQDSQDGHKITLTPSSGTAQTITIPDNDTKYTATSPVVVTGTVISHANSGVTAASKGDTSNQTPGFGDTFKVPSGTVNATGHLTAFADHTVKIPDTAATTSTAGQMSATDKTKVNRLEFTRIAADDTKPWATIGGKTASQALRVVRDQGSSNSWVAAQYASGISFGEADTHGYLGLSHSSDNMKPTLAMAAGSTTNSTDAAPNWYMKIRGTNEKTYDLDYVSPVEIASSTDLNDVIQDGFYVCGQNSIVTTLSNSPTTNAFWLEVHRTVSTQDFPIAGCEQILSTYQTGTHQRYVRRLYNGTWGNWTEWKETDTTYSAATQSAAGQMSAADKKKLDGVAASANNYSQPLAANGTRGGIQIGYTASGNNFPVKLSSEKAYVTADGSAIINALGEGTSPAQADDYLVAQYAGGGTTTTTYHRRKVSNVVNKTIVDKALSTNSTHGNAFYRKDGTWQVPAGTYSLPLAANGTRGGVQVGYTQSGKNYPVQLSNEKMYVNVPWSDTVYTHPSYTALTGNPTQNGGPTFGGTFTVSQVKTDATGHVTSLTDRTLTIPSSTATTQVAGQMSADDKTKVNLYTADSGNQMLTLETGAWKYGISNGKYRKIGKTVQVRLNLLAGSTIGPDPTASRVIATLPTGYRPTDQETYTGIIFTGEGATFPVQVTVGTNGQIRVYDPPVTITASNIVSMDLTLSFFVA